MATSLPHLAQKRYNLRNLGDLQPMFRSLIPFLAAQLILCFSAFAQSSGGGTIQGTVKDPSGAVIPGTRISIIHLATNSRTDTTSNHEGFYSTPPINIGRYKVRV